jgi:hypothetical protein
VSNSILPQPEPSWKCLEDGRARWRQVPDAPTAFMYGAAQAWQNNQGLIRLQYTDGTEEFALCPEIDLGVETSWFRIVDAVQRRRDPEFEL